LLASSWFESVFFLISFVICSSSFWSTLYCFYSLILSSSTCFTSFSNSRIVDCFSSSLVRYWSISCYARSFCSRLASYVFFSVCNSSNCFWILLSSSFSSERSFYRSLSLAADISRRVSLSLVTSAMEFSIWTMSFFISSSSRLSLLMSLLSFSTSRLYYFSQRVFSSNSPSYFFSKTRSSICSDSCSRSSLFNWSSSFWSYSS